MIEQELIEKNHLLSTLLQTTRQGYWFIGTEGLTTDINPAMCSLLGRSREAVIGHSVFDFFEGEDLVHLRKEIDARRQGKTGAYEISILRPDGTRVHCVNNATPLFDTKGQRVGSVGLWTDITERRNMEIALRVYERVANSVTEMVSVIGQDDTYRLVNDEWCRRTGLAREEVVGRTSAQVLPTVATGERQRVMGESIASQQPRMVRSSVDMPGLAGRDLETHYYPYVEEATGMRCVVVVTRDVTEEEQGRRQLAIGAEVLRGTLNATGDAIFASDAASPAQPVRFVNEQMLRMWGIPVAKRESLTPADIMAAAALLFDDPQGEAQIVREVIAANVAHESRLRLRDGRVLLRRCIPAVIDEQVVRVWSFRDITAQERAMHVVRTSEAEQRALLDAFPGFITCMNADFVYTYANRQVAQRLGITPEAMVGRPIREVVGAEVHTWLHPLLERALTGEPVTYERRHETGDADGLTDQVTLARGADPATGRPVIYTFGFDITDRKRAERQLRSATDQLSRTTHELEITLDSMAQGIVSVDAQGIIRFCNRRALELLDLPESVLRPGATVKENFRFLVQRGDFDADGSFVDVDGKRWHLAGPAANAPLDYVRKTRAGRLLEVRARHVQGGGQVRTYADVTAYGQAQQALRDSEAELRAVLTAFPGYITAIDQDYIYSYVNERLAGLFGRPAQQIIGRHGREIVGEQRFEANRLEIELAKAGGPTSSERHYPARANQAQLDLEVTHVAGTQRPDGRQMCYVFGTDITARKRAEAALTAARDEADRANRAKSEFLSRMSHELRTPMNAILGFGQLLEITPQFGMVQREWVREINRGGQHLLDLINDVLDLARVESGKFSVSPEPVALRPLVDECLMLVRQQAQERSVALLDVPLACDLHVRADRTRLKQVLLNLLSNAVKYNGDGGQAGVDCAVHGAAVRIGVRDTGAGLTPEQQARLFVPFERLDADQTHVEGTGIGLALSKRLMELMGGSIGVHSSPGMGSTFWVELPLAQGADVRDPAGPTEFGAATLPAQLDAQRIEVLCIEDNPANLRLIEGIMAKRPGIHLLTAMDPSRGLELARQRRPALILLDINLPDMDGYAVLRCLRENAATRDIPVFAVSANAMLKDAERGKAAGFAEYLTKPINVARLLAALDHWLGAAGAASTGA